MNLFGRKKPEEPKVAPPPANAGSSAQGAITKVRETIEVMEKREAHIQRKIDDEIKKAKANMAKNDKRAAMQNVKRKKLYEKQLEQVGNSKITLETQQMALESMNMNREILDATRVAAKTIQAETKAMGGADGVDELMDQVEDGLNDAQEVSDALSRTVGVPGVDMDEDDLLAELEQLEQDDLVDQLGSVELDAAPTAMPAAPVSMPSAPTAQPKGMTAEEKELAELEAAMAM